MSGRRSRNKGKRGEREVAALLSEAGFPARRSQQFKGTKDSADIDCPTLPFTIEVKLRERHQVEAWLDLAKQEAGSNEAVVFIRRNRKPWYVALDADLFLDLMRRARR